MYEANGSPGVVAQLSASLDELVLIHRRLVSATTIAPHGDAAGWEGIAAVAYRLSLRHVLRDLASAEDLLRSASQLTAAALADLGGHV